MKKTSQDVTRCAATLTRMINTITDLYYITIASSVKTLNKYNSKYETISKI